MTWYQSMVCAVGCFTIGRWTAGLIGLIADRGRP